MPLSVEKVIDPAAAEMAETKARTAGGGGGVRNMRRQSVAVGGVAHVAMESAVEAEKQGAPRPFCPALPRCDRAHPLPSGRQRCVFRQGRRRTKVLDVPAAD